MKAKTLSRHVNLIEYGAGFSEEKNAENRLKIRIGKIRYKLHNFLYGMVYVRTSSFCSDGKSIITIEREQDSWQSV